MFILKYLSLVCTSFLQVEKYKGRHYLSKLLTKKQNPSWFIVYNQGYKQV